jgi:hypothetical protein
MVTDSSGTGLHLRGDTHAAGNAIAGSRYAGIVVVSPFSGTIEKNNLVDNGRGPSAGTSANCGIENVDVVGLTVGINYWGRPPQETARATRARTQQRHARRP